MVEPQRPKSQFAEPALSVGDSLGNATFSVSGESMVRFEAPTRPGDLGRLGRYHVHRQLGQGSMGAVFQAFDERLRREVALKVLLPHEAAHPLGKERFLREARAAANIRSDHVITIHEIDETAGQPYIAMPLLVGRSLEAYFATDPSPTFAEIVRMGREIATGLAAAHAVGVIHRDVKPANLWLEAPGSRVIILDFGLAKPIAEPKLTKTGAILGTPAYMAPEQADATPLDVRADLFSLGCVLYQLCTGVSPFARPTVPRTMLALLNHNPAPVHDLNDGTPLELSKLVDKLLQKDRARRPACADDVVRALEGMRG